MKNKLICTILALFSFAFLAQPCDNYVLNASAGVTRTVDVSCNKTTASYVSLSEPLSFFSFN